MLFGLVLLLVAIAAEVAATVALPRAQGLHNPGWTAFVLGGYAVSIWLLAVVVRHMSVSTAYAIWAGLGTAAVAVIGAVWMGESWDAIKVGALALIIVGVVTLNLHGAH